MGGTQSRTERRTEGYRRNVDRSPSFVDISNYGEGRCTGNSSSAEKIDKAMSETKVSIREANCLEQKLKSTYFTQWDENCEFRRYSGYTMTQTDDLLRTINQSFNIPGFDAYNKLKGIRFTSEMDVKIYNFSFGDELDKGVVHFGMVAISKSGDVLEAASSLYTLNFKLGQTRVTRTERSTFLGCVVNEESTSWYEKEKLGFATQRAIINFCKVKALKEFKKQNVISRINDVHSLENV